MTGPWRNSLNAFSRSHLATWMGMAIHRVLSSSRVRVDLRVCAYAFYLFATGAGSCWEWSYQSGNCQTGIMVSSLGSARLGVRDCHHKSAVTWSSRIKLGPENALDLHP